MKIDNKMVFNYVVAPILMNVMNSATRGAMRGIRRTLFGRIGGKGFAKYKYNKRLNYSRN